MSIQFMTQDPSPPTAKPMAGPSSSSLTRKILQPPMPLPWSVATAINTRTTGSTTKSFIPASIFSTCRTGRGIRSSRTISRSTTGSVEANTAPPIKANIQPKFRNNPKGNAPMAIIKAVPGPSIRAGTNHRLPNSVICSLTASKNRTRAKVSVATTSRKGEWGPTSSTSNPRLPSRNPSPRKINGNESGDRSTKPDARALTVKTTAITPNIKIKSGTWRLYQISSCCAVNSFWLEIPGRY